MRVSATAADRFSDGIQCPLADFAGRRVHAVAGIGHPRRFFALLERAGLRVIAHAHEDHATLGPADLQFGDEDRQTVTEKDAVKLSLGSETEIWVVRIDMEFENQDGERLVAAVINRIGHEK